jgi:hypothetical protein
MIDLEHSELVQKTYTNVVPLHQKAIQYTLRSESSTMGIQYPHMNQTLQPYYEDEYNDYNNYSYDTMVAVCFNYASMESLSAAVTIAQQHSQSNKVILLGIDTEGKEPSVEQYAAQNSMFGVDLLNVEIKDVNSFDAMRMQIMNKSMEMEKQKQDSILHQMRNQQVKSC